MMSALISYATVQLLFAGAHARYEIFGEKTAAGFYEAQQFCQDIGGNLASIHDVQTNDLVTQLLKDNGAVGYGWIGFNKLTNSWTDNTLVDYNPGFIPSVHEECTAIAITDVLNQWTQVPCTNPYAFACEIPSIQSSNLVDRITSDCAGNEMERETVTIDECQFEQFPNGPSRPYKWFCDNNKLGTKYYTRGINNCDGPVELESLPPNGCADGLVFSSTCGDQSIPIPNCNHYYAAPMDTCTGSQDGQSYKFSCINDNTMKATQYEGEVCDELRIVESHELPCTLEDSCYCSAPVDNCEVAEFIINVCGDSGESFLRPSLVNECVYFGGQSHEFICNENDQLVEKHFDNANCQPSEHSTEETYPKQCLLGSTIAVTCGVKQESNLVCPEGTEQIGELNADIGGCGLEPCNNRYQDNYKNIQDCADACVSNELCVSFTWAPMNGDKNHPGKSVCTLYKGDIPNQKWAPEQIMCKPSANQLPTTTSVTRLCKEELKDFNVGAIFQSNGGCQEHFNHGAFVYQDNSGSASFADCVAKCQEFACKSFFFGRKGVTRENWCNIYSVKCTDNGDTDWYMFTPINNAQAICALQE